jgi:hypothetical protein
VSGSIASRIRGTIDEWSNQIDEGVNSLLETSTPSAFARLLSVPLNLAFPSGGVAVTATVVGVWSVICSPEKDSTRHSNLLRFFITLMSSSNCSLDAFRMYSSRRYSTNSQYLFQSSSARLSNSSSLHLEEEKRADSVATLDHPAHATNE